MREKQKICQERRYDGSLCGRPLFDNWHCIFHSEDIDKKIDRFNEVFWEEFNRQEKQDKIFDFTAFIFPREIIFSEKKITKPIVFDRSKFFNNLIFKSVTLLKDISFSGTEFYPDLDNDTPDFLENISFIVFYRVRFFGLVKFEGSIFNCELQFKEDEFLSETSFRGAEFLNEVTFNKTIFHKKVIFSPFMYDANATLEDVRSFRSRFTFYSKPVEFNNTKFFDETDFRNNYFSDFVIFNDCEFNKNVDFSQSIFQKKISIYNTYFENVIGLFEGIKRKHKTFWFFKRNIYILKDFRFTLGPKASNRYPIIARKAKDAWFLADFRRQHPIIYWLWNITSKCGRSLSRWALVSLLIALLFGAIYADYSCPPWLQWMNWGNWMEKINPIMVIDQTKAQGLGIIRKATWFTPYYFSIVTFTTLGFGDVTPVNLAGEIWLAIEVILGYIMLGGLISIFANKLARRS